MRIAQALALLALTFSSLAPCAQAAFFAQAKFAHTATLLPDGRIMSAGGIDVGGNASALIEYIDNKNANITVSAAPLVARASHTATLLPNGNVMYVGGIDNAGNPIGSIQIINPIIDAVVGVDALGTPRHSHTATLLPDGHVLICGGITSAAATFPPTFGANCEVRRQDGSAEFAMALITARGWHTATLLRDGRVFITGGNTNNGLASVPLVTSEVFSCLSPINCTGGAITGGKALSVARAYHQATMMADGRVLITGGYNGDDSTPSGHKVGYVEAAEIYDPVADAMATAAPMLERATQHSALLQPDGSVLAFGGLGNITTTYIRSVGSFTGGTLRGCFTNAECAASAGNNYGILPNVPVMSTMTINTVLSNPLPLSFNFQLSVPVTGVIQDGEVLFSSPQATIPGGKVNFVYGQEVTPGSGLLDAGIKTNLAGVPIECQNGQCGLIRRPLNITGVSGNFQFDRLTQNLTVDTAQSQDEGCLRFVNGLTSANSPTNINDGGGTTACTTNYNGTGFRSYVCGHFTIAFPSAYAGALLRIAPNMQLIAGAWTFTTPTSTGFTGTIASGIGDVLDVQPIATAIDPLTSKPTASIHVCFRQLTGTVTTNTTIPQNGPAQSTNPGATSQLTAATVRMDYTLDRVDMTGIAFKVDVATIVVRRMLSQDFQCYHPSSNRWDFNCVTPRGQANGLERFGQTATLLPNGDLDYIGGLSCNGYGQGACLNSVINPAITQLGVIQVLKGAWNGTGSMMRPRGNFTATTLPSGKILVAGGTDGQNVVSDSEIYDPVARAFTPTPQTMNTPRDLHTATLLINGRVLVAGGFATTAASTGTTNSAEMFFPDTGVWLNVAPLAQARDNHTATVMPDGRVNVVGGYQNGTYLGTMERFDASNNTWTTFAVGPQPTLVRRRALHTATLLKDGRLLVLGGVNQTGVLSSVEVFDGNQWTELITDPLPKPLHSLGAVQLENGDILVTGGTNGFIENTQSFRFRPGNGAGTRWINSGNMTSGRMNFSMTLLPNGNVLAAGGAQTSGNTIMGVELFHPGPDNWTPISSFTVARAYHVLTVTPDGQMTAFGGYDGTRYQATGESLGFAGGFDVEALQPSVRKSSITSLSAATLTRGGTINIYGRGFKGGTEASGGGSASGNSEFYHPRLLLQALDHSGASSTQGNGGFIINLTTYVYIPAFAWSGASATLSVTLPGAAPPNPAALPFGWYQMRTVNNGVYSDAKLVQAGPPLPTGAVTALTGVTISSTIINWTWNPAAVAGNLGFNVYSGTSGILIAQLPNPAANSFAQGGLQPNVTDQLVVAPYSLTGDGTLAYSGTYYTFASSPTALSVASVSVTSLELRWNSNQNAPGTIYEVSMSTDNFLTSFSTPIPSLQGVTTDHILVQSLAPSTPYWFRVQAYNFVGLPSSQTSPPTASGFTNVVSTTTRQTVSGLTGTRTGTTSIQWTWTDAGINTGAGDRYRVYNSTSGQLLASAITPVFLDVGLGTNTQRSVMVSVFTFGVGEGPLTPAASAYTDAAVPNSASPPILNLSTGGFTVAWTANGNPFNTTYQCVITARTPIDASSGPVTGSTFTTTGFFCGTTGLFPPASVYDLRVRAVNGDGFFTDAVDPTRLLQLGTTSTLATSPTLLTVLGTSPSSISLIWNTSNNASSATYEVTYSQDNFVADVRYARTFAQRGNSNSITIAGLATSTAYNVRVRAQNLDGVKTAYSNLITTSTFNGGAPPGALGALIPANAQATLTGTLGNGRAVTLFVPNNAFPIDVFVAISSQLATPGPCGSLNVAVQVTLTPPIQPLKPVLMTLGYLPAELGAVPISQATFERWDPMAQRCVPLKTTFDTVAQTFTAQLNHFSLFQLAQLKPQATPDFASIFPNPFYPTRGNGYVTFAQLPVNAKVGIYTLRGEFAWEGWTNGAGLMTWTGINTAGRPVASGVYLAVVESGGQKHIYKVAVVR